nr:hypothetical protein [Tanacetum cinerariifolium]
KEGCASWDLGKGTWGGREKGFGTVPVWCRCTGSVVTTAKLMTQVVTAVTTPISAAIITAAPTAARRRKWVVIRDPKETDTPSTIIHSEPKFKDKGKGIMVEEPKPLKKQAQIEQDEAYGKQDNAVLRYQALKRKPQTEAQARKNMKVYLKNMAGFKMDYFNGMSYDDICPIFEKYFNSNVAFLEKSKEELEEEEGRVLKRKTESSKEKATKKQKYDEEVEELKKHLQIVPNDDDDDVYTEATPLALKVPILDYEIFSENNKPYYKIIRADGSQQLFLSFLSLLRNFDREDLYMLWQIVQERFASSTPKNFSNDILLTTLTYMFEKPDVEAQVWKNQRGVHGLAKVKSWRLLESRGVHIITFTTTQMILLVERRYPLTRFTLDQMLNNVRLEVKEESEVSLELLRFTYCCSYKLMLWDDAADIKLRLLKQSVAVGPTNIALMAYTSQGSSSLDTKELDSEDKNVVEKTEQKKTVKPSLEKIKFVNARNTTVENESKAEKPRKLR